MDQGLFVPKEPDQGALFSLRGDAEPRRPFVEGFPEVAVQQRFGSPARPTAHPDYKAAKSGDPAAAARFADAMVTSQGLAAVKKMAGNARATLVAVHAEESTGRNAIPIAYAAVLARRLNLPVDMDIVQSNKVFRTGSGALHRMTTPVAFDGTVEPGKSYLLVDDHTSQGGTLADLRSYIENRGGKVVGATTLTAAPDGHMLAPISRTLDALRAKLPGIDAWMTGSFGHDTSSLTEAEARYLTRFNSLDSLRNQIAATKQTSHPGGGAQGTSSTGSGEASQVGVPGGVASPSDKPQYSDRDDGRA
jgi:hypothetical protein